ncbi:metallophosphoesterase family protein [Xanthovirga aplysinae]|uniref:metallophosphoesterase family protein n=1 Tax=Xanthovirga aplysinae TaxID=2529853 RepID=UPI0012BB702F|nr:metallophosphoesterase family protein [Xanthovirga aplysinae]MTI33172.1 metallophosphoesterase [Xanthovirga aplysinae]
MKIGLLSDTHGYLDERIFYYLEDCDEIWHAGDVGSLEVLEKLEQFKPTKGVFGNIDGQNIRIRWPENQRFSCQGLDIWITHIGGRPPKYNPKILAQLKQNPPNVFVCGHSHILQVSKDPNFHQMLFLNPGAAGKQGFHRVRTILRFEINSGDISNLQAIELGKRS